MYEGDWDPRVAMVRAEREGTEIGDRRQWDRKR